MPTRLAVAPRNGRRISRPGGRPRRGICRITYLLRRACSHKICPPFMLYFRISQRRGRISKVTLQRNEANGDSSSPFVELDRQTWSRLGAQMEQPLNEEDIIRLRGLGD